MEKDGAGWFSVKEQNAQRDVERWFMNILVIGNGFDLAHGLPTKFRSRESLHIGTRKMLKKLVR